jgi:hypothetical protein
VAYCEKESHVLLLVPLRCYEDRAVHRAKAANLVKAARILEQESKPRSSIACGRALRLNIVQDGQREGNLRKQ